MPVFNQGCNEGFKEHFNGVRIPFGALVDFKPSPTKNCIRRCKWEPKALPGVFFGYSIGQGGKWTGDLLCVELSNFRNMNWRTGRDRRKWPDTSGPAPRPSLWGGGWGLDN